MNAQVVEFPEGAMARGAEPIEEKKRQRKGPPPPATPDPTDPLHYARDLLREALMKPEERAKLDLWVEAVVQTFGEMKTLLAQLREHAYTEELEKPKDATEMLELLWAERAQRAEREKLYWQIFQRTGRLVSLLGDFSLGLQDACRKTFVETHGSYLRALSEIEAGIRRDVSSKLDGFAVSVARCVERQKKLQDENVKFDHSLRAQFYALCERGVFLPAKLDEESSKEKRDQIFDASFANYQQVAERLYPERLGVLRGRGAAGELLLLGGAKLNVFNVEEVK